MFRWYAIGDFANRHGQQCIRETRVLAAGQLASLPPSSPDQFLDFLELRQQRLLGVQFRDACLGEVSEFAELTMAMMMMTMAMMNLMMAMMTMSTMMVVNDDESWRGGWQ